MRLLFVMGRVLPIGDANTNVVARLLSGLPHEDVQVLSVDDAATDPTDQEWHGHMLHRISTLSRYGRFRRHSRSQSRLRRTLAIFRDPRLAASYGASRLRSHSPRAAKLRRARAIRQKIAVLQTQTAFDAIVAVSEPFETCIALAGLKTSARKVMYELDPFSSKLVGGVPQQHRWRMALERRVERSADLILLTRLIYDERTVQGLPLSQRKHHILDFPLIRDSRSKVAECSILRSTERIRCVFVGQLYSGVREPSYVLEIASKLGVPCDFYFVGPGCDGLNVEESSTDKVQFFGIPRQPLDVALALMNQADVLVNIGNSIPNQMPSKILDYISTGNPILNFHKLDNCPTLEFTGRYPLSLDVLEGESDVGSVVTEVERFLLSAQGKHVAYDEIERLFGANTPSAVGVHLTRLIVETLKV